MTIYLILFGAFLSFGLFFIFADVLKLPTIASRKAIISMGHNSKKKASFIDALVLNLSVKLTKFVRLDEFKKIRLHNTLLASGINQTPEFYTANCIVKSILIGVWALPLLLVFPLVSPLFLIVGILVY